jgi:hypothetical protein
VTVRCRVDGAAIGTALTVPGGCLRGTDLRQWEPSTAAGRFHPSTALPLPMTRAGMSVNAARKCSRTCDTASASARAWAEGRLGRPSAPGDAVQLPGLDADEVVGDRNAEQGHGARRGCRERRRGRARGVLAVVDGTRCICGAGRRGPRSPASSPPSPGRCTSQRRGTGARLVGVGRYSPGGRRDVHGGAR